MIPWEDNVWSLLNTEKSLAEIETFERFLSP